MRREKIYFVSVLACSILIVGIIILLAKTYWTSSSEESTHLLNETASFERNFYQEREKQNFSYAESRSSLDNETLK